MPQYKLANFEKADHLEAIGDHRFEEAKDATEHADSYIFGTVFFAAVLFFAGISMRFNWLADAHHRPRTLGDLPRLRGHPPHQPADTLSSLVGVTWLYRVSVMMLERWPRRSERSLP